MRDTNLQYDLFLSYNTQDHVFVTQLAKQLEAQSTKAFLDRWHLIPGQPWPERLRKVLASCKAVAVCIGPHEMGPWQQREMYFALERQHREPNFPVIPVLLPDGNPPLDFLSQNMWVDIRGGLDNPMALAILQAAIRGETLAPEQTERVQELIRTICPYRGLEFFREQDATFFFGREQAVKDLQEKLASHHLVALIGASGAGKSSVVRAGLLPSLRKNTENPWEIVTIVPGDRPLHNLAAAFIPLLEPQLTETDLLTEISKQAKALLTGEIQIRDVVERILAKQPGSERFLLVVDQWEELYTLAKPASQEKAKTTEPDQAKIFIDGLLAACKARKLHVVLTLRGDFMGQAIAYRPLSDGLKDAQVNLSAMTPDELQQSIEQPALKLNTGFDQGLIDLLLTDVGGEPGHLPLLEFVLKRLWNDPQRGDKLRLNTYKAMGRLKGALQQQADDLYKKLPSEHEQHALRDLLLQLVTINDSNAYTRCRANQDNLKQYNHLIKQMTDARLLVNNSDDHSNQSTLEVAHEALIEGWPKLTDWLKQNREFMAWRKRLKQAMADYQARHDKQALLKGQHLRDAVTWTKRQTLNQQEISFINRCRHQFWWNNLKLTMALLLPLVVVTGFFGWASVNELKTDVAVDVLRAKYLKSVREPDMVTIPPVQACSAAKPCEFIMGSNDGKDESTQPPHSVSFSKPFKMGLHEVTFDEYQVFAYMINQQGGCPVEDSKGADKREPVMINHSGWGTGQQPAINLSWYQARCYVRWLSQITGKNFHLPTEAQWEYAARGGSTSKFHWGGDEQQASQYAWFGANSAPQTHPVADKQLKPNPFGLYDMTGNVWEWTEDCWHEGYENAPIDGSAWLEKDNGDCSSRVLRGGSWGYTALKLRSATRYMYYADLRNNSVGFRLAQD